MLPLTPNAVRSMLEYLIGHRRCMRAAHDYWYLPLPQTLGDPVSLGSRGSSDRYPYKIRSVQIGVVDVLDILAVDANIISLLLEHGPQDGESQAREEYPTVNMVTGSLRLDQPDRSN